jgi:DNA-binding response OmpR family regulator
MRVLIAEDDLVAGRLLRKTLESWGYSVFTAEGGRQEQGAGAQRLRLSLISPEAVLQPVLQKVRQEATEVGKSREAGETH